MAKVKPKFDPGDIVYLISDPDQVKRQIVEVVETPIGFTYNIRMDGELINVYDIELDITPSVI